MASDIFGGTTVLWSAIESLILFVLLILVFVMLVVLLKNRSVKKQTDNDYTRMSLMLRDTFTEFGNKIDKSLKETIDGFGSKLTSVVMEVNLSSKVLDDTVDKFDKSIMSLVENMNKITEFNSNLSSNIEKMDNSYKNLTNTLTSTSNTIVDNYGSIGTLAKDIKDAAGEMTSYNREIVQDLSNIVSEVKGSISSIKDLSDVLKNDMSTRSEEAKEYQDNINMLLEKVSGDISILGYNTATAFSKSIEETAKATSEKVSGDFGKIADDIQSAAMSIKGFGEVLKNDMSTRSEEVKEYQGNINKLMERINEEIANIGQKTVSAFSLSLEESAKSTSEKVVQDFGKVAAEVEGAISLMKDLNEALKGDLDTRIHEAKEYHENITRLMLKISGEMTVLGQNTTDAFSQSLEGTGQAISHKVTQSMDEVFKGVLGLLDEFKENEKQLAKTIVMLPDQVITYNETAANKIGMQIDEIKRLFRNNSGF